MRRTALILGALLVGMFACPSAEAQCGIFGKIFSKRARAQQASACYSSQSIQYSACAVQQNAPATYATPQYQYLQAPAKSTPQAAPPLPLKSTPQSSMNESAPLPPRAPGAEQLALPKPPPAEDEPPQVAVAAPVVVVATDPYGYQPHLNGFRARFGLRPLRYNANLSGWAYQNSLRGFGHTVIPPGARQNAAWGQQDVATLERDWESSPGHAAAMLDPNVTDYGIAVASNVWTLNMTRTD